MAKKQRFRMRFTFWLDLLKTDEADLAALIEQYKEARAFVGAIRDGLRLISDLKQGRVGVLLEIAPWVQEYFQPKNTDIVQQFVDMLKAGSYPNTLSQSPARELPPHPGIGGVDVAPPVDDGNSSESFLDQMMGF
jgi:hypothetical protein